MKKLLFAMAMLVLMTTACSKDEMIGSHDSNISLITLNVTTPELATRAYGDGKSVSKLSYGVYMVNANNTLTFTTAYNDATDISAGSPATVKLALANGFSYKILFWADKEDSAPYTIDWENKTVTLNYDGLESQQENLDAFFGYVDATDVNGPSTTPIDVKLKRPFAQLNIATSDKSEAAAHGFNVNTTSVTVKAYTQLNLIDGSVGGQTDISFAPASIPTEENATLEVDSKSYTRLAMNYLLVNEKELVDVTLVSMTENGLQQTRTFGNVPVQRNYRTNIIGKILTSDHDYKVQVDNTFDPSSPNKVYVVSTLQDILDAIAAAGSQPITIILNNDLVIDGTSYNSGAVININGTSGSGHMNNTGVLTTRAGGDHGKHITFDLNGFTTTVKNIVSGVSLFNVGDGCTLTIKDSSASNTGTFDFSDSSNLGSFATENSNIILCGGKYIGIDTSDFDVEGDITIDLGDGIAFHSSDSPYYIASTGADLATIQSHASTNSDSPVNVLIDGDVKWLVKAGENADGSAHGTVDFIDKIYGDGGDDFLRIVGGGVPSIKDITIENLTFYDEGTYKPNSNEFGFQNFEGECSFTNVNFKDGIRIQSGTTTLTNCDFEVDNTIEFYTLWIDAGASVTYNGGSMDCNRAIKIGDQYSNGETTLNVSNVTFKSTGLKAAILATTKYGATITLDNININDVTADNENAVWVDDERADYWDTITVTGGSKFLEGATAVSTVDALKAAIEGDDKSIMLAAGSYELGTYAINRDVKIIGAGSNQTSILGNISLGTSGSPVISFSGISFEWTTKGTSTNAATDSPIVISQDNTQVTFKNCVFKRAASASGTSTYGIYCQNRAKSLVIEGCTFESSFAFRAPIHGGMYGTESAPVRIVNNTFNSGDERAISLEQEGKTFEYIRIENNDFGSKQVFNAPYANDTYSNIWIINNTNLSSLYFFYDNVPASVSNFYFYGNTTVDNETTGFRGGADGYKKQITTTAPTE